LNVGIAEKFCSRALILFAWSASYIRSDMEIGKKLVLKCICILLLFGIGQGSAHAQGKEIELTYGTEFDPQGSINEFIGQIGDVIYVSSWKKGFILGGVDANTLKSRFEVKIPMPEYKGETVEFKEIHILDNQLVIFMEYFDREAQKHFLFAQQVSDKGDLQGDMIKLDEISAEKRRNAGSFSVDVYTVSKRILVFRSPPFEKYGKEKFAFKVLDKDLEIIWQDELELPYADQYFTLDDFFVDDNDHLYVTASFDDYRQTKELDGRKKAKVELRERGGNYNTYKIISYDYQQKKIKEFEIALDAGLSIIDIGYNIDPAGDINVSGFYGDQQSKGSAIGVYFTKIDHKTKKPTSLHLKEFEKEWIKGYMETFMSEKNAERSIDKGVGISDLQIREFVNRTDGGLLIVGEIYRYYRSCYTDSRGYTRCTDHYIYGSIFVINVDPEGVIDWVAAIPKMQHTVNDGGYYSSYAMIVDDGGLYFIFNDNAKNYDPKKKPNKLYSMGGTKRSVTTIAKVDNAGKITKEPNAKLKAEKMLLRPKVRRTVIEKNNRKLLLLAKYGKKERVVEMHVQR